MTKKPSSSVHDASKFQLERIALFSDAVFAIAITLLIIEIKIPELKHSGEFTDAAMGEQLLDAITKFIGFFISFFVIGQYWFAHHRMFMYVQRSSHKLLWNNLLFLLPMVIMPFSTSLLSEYYFNSNLQLPLAVYTATICLSGYFCYRLWKTIANPANHLSNHVSKNVIQYNISRTMVLPTVFLVALLFSFINIRYSYFIPLFTPLITLFVKKRYTRKHPEMMKELHG